MDVQNLVLEIEENESAADVQARLDKAGADGFFLVNVIGRLALLRKSIVVKKALGGVSVAKTGGAQANVDGKDDAAARIIRHNSLLPIRRLVALLGEAGIKRKKTWVGEMRMKQRAELRSLVNN